jgi:undecaprenyl-diphosphatase
MLAEGFAGMGQAIDHIALAIIEGFSEFLPVSSTGHMIIYDELFARTHDDSRVTYMIVIQAGAIAAIAHIYFARLIYWLGEFIAVLRKKSGQSVAQDGAHWFLLKLACAVIPFGIVGLLFKDQVKALFSAKSVGGALLVGGLLLIFDDLRMRRNPDFRPDRVEGLTWFDAIVVGCCQCMALWPGFSRSAAAILGARARGFSPRTAAEISFLIGLPTIGGTALYEFAKSFATIRSDQIVWLCVGSGIAWFTAFVSVKWFLSIVSRGGLMFFGIYRCVVGIFLLTYL